MPVYMLSSATTMNPPMPSGTARKPPPDAPRMSSMLPRPPELQRMCLPPAAGVADGVPPQVLRLFEDFLDGAVGEHDCRLTLQRLVILTREHIAAFRRQQQLVDLIEDSARNDIRQRRIR